MMALLNENIFRVNGPLWREFTRHRRILLTKARDVSVNMIVIVIRVSKIKTIYTYIYLSKGL